MSETHRYSIRPLRGRSLIVLLLCLSSGVAALHAGGQADSVARALLTNGLRENHAYALLKELTEVAGHRLSGSDGAARAVEVTQQMMRRLGFENVRVESLMVPRWVRGSIEEAVVLNGRGKAVRRLHACALGGSVATPPAGLSGELLEVLSMDELHKAGDRVRGRIVFFNRPMDPTEFHTFAGYGGAVGQRAGGAIEAAQLGAVAVLVRSVTLALDDVPHTGSVNYQTDVPRIPAMAVSTLDANMLSGMMTSGKSPRVRMRLACRTLPDAPSANVLGELRGSELPNEIVVVGGHLDSWDVGEGAHDDGAGCVQAIEALRLLKELGVRPKRTIRAVMFMNEENGSRGGKAYAAAAARSTERHRAAIEADRGGFTPRGYSVQGDSATLEHVRAWRPLFALLGADTFIAGHSGVDVSPLMEHGAVGFGLLVDFHRYFDYHHSANDILANVHPRELELGAIANALLCYLIAEEGL